MKRLLTMAVAVIMVLSFVGLANAETTSKRVLLKKQVKLLTGYAVVKPNIRVAAFQINAFLKYNGNPIGGTLVKVYEVDSSGNKVQADPIASGTVVDLQAKVPFTLLGSRNYVFVSRCHETSASQSPWIGAFHEIQNLNANTNFNLNFAKPVPNEVSEYWN